MQFDINGCSAKTIEDKEIAKKIRDGNFYIINCKRINRVEVVAFVEFSSNKDKIHIWH